MPTKNNNYFSSKLSKIRERRVITQRETPFKKPKINDLLSILNYLPLNSLKLIFKKAVDN